MTLRSRNRMQICGRPVAPWVVLTHGVRPALPCGPPGRRFRFTMPDRPPRPRPLPGLPLGTKPLSAVQPEVGQRSNPATDLPAIRDRLQGGGGPDWPIAVAPALRPPRAALPLPWRQGGRPTVWLQLRRRTAAVMGHHLRSPAAV